MGLVLDGHPQLYISIFHLSTLYEYNNRPKNNNDVCIYAKYPRGGSFGYSGQVVRSRRRS